MKTILACAALAALSPLAVSAPAPLTSFLKDATAGEIALRSIGSISFGPQGLLLLAEPSAAAIIAIDTGDVADKPIAPAQVEDLNALLAGALETKPENLQIIDMAANPASGKVYLSVRDTGTKKLSLVTVDSAGKATLFNLAGRPHLRVSLSPETTNPIRNISDLAFAQDRVLVTGQSNEEFSSKIFSIPLPLSARSSTAIFSAETYHVAHKRWETKAPIQAFIPYDDKGKACVVGAFACTPIAKFPISDLSSGANVRGTSVVELGSGNRPIDLFAYTDAQGKGWIVTNTNRFHQPLFGPSKYWGVRVSTDYLDRSEPEQINEQAARRNVKEKAGPAGIEIFDALSGAVQISKLNDQTMVVLRENGDKLQLATAALP